MEKAESVQVPELPIHAGLKQEMDLSYAKTEESGVFSASNCSSLDQGSSNFGNWESFAGEVTDPKAFDPPVECTAGTKDIPSFLCNISTILHTSDQSDKCKCIVALTRW